MLFIGWCGAWGGVHVIHASARAAGHRCRWSSSTALTTHVTLEERTTNEYCRMLKYSDPICTEAAVPLEEASQPDDKWTEQHACTRTGMGLPTAAYGAGPHRSSGNVHINSGAGRCWAGHIAEEVNLLFSIPLASFNRSGRCDDDRFHWKRVGAAVPASRPPVSVSRVHWWMPLFFSAPRAWLR